MLPFALPQVTRGHAELTAAARAAGAEAAQAAACSLAALLGCEVRISGRPLPGHGAPGAGCARQAFDLPALPGTAALEVDAAFVARVVDRMAGGAGELHGATALTPVEAAAFELLSLAALDGIARREDVERALSPRLARGAVDPASPLAVALEIEVGGERGRARLLLPPEAARALRGDPELPDALGALAVGASLRRGRASLSAEEVEALGAGDVVLLDEEPAPREVLVLPGGFRLEGRLADGFFHLEESRMTDTAASMPLTLEVELARVPVTLADLARLEPGASFPLPVDRRGLVTLRLGERAIARGELVDVDGAVGVRVLSLERGP